MRIFLVYNLGGSANHGSSPACLMKKTAPRKALADGLTAFMPVPTQPADWVINEFAQAALPDERHRLRLQMITTAFAQKPTAPIPEACAGWAEARGAYRFLANDRIPAGAIRQAHEQATRQRVQPHPVVLAVQDTTSLNYSTHPKTKGLGLLGSHSPKSIGLLLHSTLAITPGGQPLGFLHSAVRARRGCATVHRHQRKLADKESYKWVESLAACQKLVRSCPATRLVNLADREGDLYDLFAQALSVPDTSKVHLLVRARHDRPLADGQGTVWAEVGRQPVAATLAVLVGRRGEQPGRLARLNLRFCRVQLRAPRSKTSLPAITVWAIEAAESTPVPGGSARIR